MSELDTATDSGEVVDRASPERQKCETCGNVYDKAFQVVMGGESHTFDSFECAIQLLAPVCSHCGCRIIGHGIEADGSFFCCASCAKLGGVTEARDRA